MDKKILITGPPRCGKSTTISKLINYYTVKKNYKICGFLTPEVRERNNRIGFDIVDIFTGNRSELARVGVSKINHRVGKYNVFVDKFDEYLEKSLNLDEKSADLIVIDEIGKMELFSVKFQNFIKKIFSSKLPVLATIGLKLSHPLKNYLLNIPSVEILNLNRQNSQIIFEKVKSLLS